MKSLLGNSMSRFLLSQNLTDQILAYLGCKREKPSIRYLNRLIQGYIHHVPWESVSRIIKRHITETASGCPRWPEEFWHNVLLFGTGGTCFESNLAFYTLLTMLGFDGYLTINDMEEPACHTASIIMLRQQKYLVDAGIPLHCALPLHSERITKRATKYHQYTIRPIENSEYWVERSHHPKRKIFTLRDKPISIEEYKRAVEKDYEVTGYFLDQVIIVKVIENRIWRFNNDERPNKLEGFDKTSKQEVFILQDKLAQSLAEHFGIEEGKIASALSYMQSGC